MTDVVIPYAPRPLQKDLHNALLKYRWGVVVCHRRFGKTLWAINHLIMRAMTTGNAGRFAYFAPFLKQAKSIAWDYLKHFSRPIPGITINETELRIDYPNGSRIRLLGADNPDSQRGVYLDGVMLDEYAQMQPSLFTEILRPALSDRKGWAVFLGTPKGRGLFYDLYTKACADPDWIAALYRADETNILDPEELASARAMMSEDEFSQEYLCFPPGSMVAAANDVRPIETLRVGELVWTHTGRLRRIEETICSPYSGELIVIESYGSRPLRLTPEHPVYVCTPSTQTYTWKPANEVVIGDWLVTPKKNNGLPIISAAMAEIIAWFIAEGHIGGNAIVFSLGAHEIEYVERIKQALKEIGRTCTVRNARTVVQIQCNDVALADFLVAYCGSLAENKRIPLAMISGHEELVFKTLIDGDGHFRRLDGQGRHRMSYMYTTISEQLVQQVQMLGATLGLGGSYVVRKGGSAVIDGREIYARESYSVQLYKSSNYDCRNNNVKIRHAKNGILGKVNCISRESYEGSVYNLTVERDNSYIVNTRAVHNCSWQAALKGAYFAAELATARQQGRITKVPHNPALLVSTWWDLGMDDATAIWFTQDCGREIHVIDYYENNGEGLAHYRDVLDSYKLERGYRYDGHHGPHDLAVRELGSGTSRAETAAGMGLPFTVVPRVAHKADAIQSARNLLGHVWIDETRCAQGIIFLESYRKEWDDTRQVFRDKPLHDSSSHAADALMTLARGHTFAVEETAFRYDGYSVIDPLVGY